MLGLFGIQINLWAILVAAIAYMIIGMIYYAPKVAGKKCMKLAKIKKSKVPFSSIIIGLVSTFIMALGLAHIVGWIAHDIIGGLIAGAFVWLFFISTQAINAVLWERKPWSLYCLNNFYNLIVLIVMGIIIGLM